MASLDSGRLPSNSGSYGAAHNDSEMGQQRTHASQQKRTLFDHLAGAQQNRWGYRKAERLRGLEVDDHLKFCRKLHRKIARLGAAQDAIDIGGAATKGVYLVDSVGEQTPVSGKYRLRTDQRYVVSDRRRYDRRAMHDCESIRDDDKAASRIAPKAEDGCFDFCVALNGRRDWRDLE